VDVYNGLLGKTFAANCFVLRLVCCLTFFKAQKQIKWAPQDGIILLSLLVLLLLFDLGLLWLQILYI